MTKLFKNSKSILSLVLAFAVLAVSLFTGVAIHADAADTGIIYWDGSTKTEPTTTDAEGNILITSAAELAYITSNTVSGNYKIADDIDVIVLQPEATVTAAGGLERLMGLTDYNQTKDYFEKGIENDITFSSWTNTGTFQGTFDGNGVEIYGIYISSSARAGLFYQVNETTTIKNLVVKNSYLKSTEWGYGGTIVGYALRSDAYKATIDASTNKNKDATEYVTFEKCVVSGCYVSLGQKAYGGVLMGQGESHINIAMRNCLIHDNYAVSSKGEEGLTGNVSSGHNYTGGKNTELVDCIILDCIPYCSNTQGQGYKPSHYTDVYTNKKADHNPCGQNAGTSDINAWYTDGKITLIDSKDEIKGEAAVATCPGLDWNNTWFANEGIPALRSAHNIVQKAENKHMEECADCGMQGIIATDHNYVDRKCTICDDTLDCGEGVIYWNGTADSVLADNGETGADWDNAIIIDSAEELYYIATQRQTPNDNGKWYKIADHIDTIVLQPKGVVDLDTLKACADANAVKTYLSSCEGLKNWSDGVTQDRYFNGNFDGNGVEIYGLYSENLTTGGATGLFIGVEPWFPAEGNWTLTDDNNKTYYYDTNLDEPVVLQNFAIKNSYYLTARRAGAIIGMTGTPNFGTNYTGSIKISGCEVSNCYMEAAEGSDAKYKGEQGLLLGAVDSDHFTVDNCLVYGNVTRGADGNPFAIYANRGAFKAVPTEKNGNMFRFAGEDPIIENVTSNSIILGVEPYCSDSRANNRNCAAACFENVYTDAPAGEVEFGFGKVTYAETDIKNISGLTGAELVAACDALDWEKTFLATAGMPEFRAMHDAEFKSTSDETAHKVVCSCGLVVSEGAHEWDFDTCKECGYVCQHGDNFDAIEILEAEPATCVFPAYYYEKCTICEYSSKDIEDGTWPEGSALGHQLTLVPGEPATCTKEGKLEHNHCDRCGNNYGIIDQSEPIDIVIAKKPHAPATDASGTVWAFDDNYHWSYCKDCGKDEVIGEKIAHNSDDWTIDGANGHKGTCSDCGLEQNEIVPHNFGDDNVCDDCKWTCSAHTYADGEAIELTIEQRNDPAYKDVCSYVEQICSICGHKGENRIVAHTAGDWETPVMDMNKVPACAGEGSHTELKICTVCFSTVDERTVTDPKTGHSFTEYEACEPDCVYQGNVAYKHCFNCNYSFAADAADDEAYENALTDEELYIPADPEAHAWVEYKANDADCENDGYTKDHKYCSSCFIFAIEDETTDIAFDIDKFYEREYADENDWEGTPVGVGAIADAYAQELYDETWAQFLADNGVVLPEEPAEDADLEEWNAYYEEYYAALENVDTEAFDAIWAPIYAEIMKEAYHQYFLAAAAADEENAVELVIPAVGHKLEEVKEVPATYEKDGVKAHYACECGKLYSDAEGKNEVKAEELVIAKLVKEEEKPADKPADKPAGDDSDKSPVTGDSVASVAAVAALMGAAFVLVRKSKKS